MKCRTEPVNRRSADWTLLQTQAIGESEYLKLQTPPLDVLVHNLTVHIDLRADTHMVLIP